MAHFLRSNAIRFERADKSRTYLILDGDDSSPSSGQILAYFSLSTKEIVLPNNLSKSQVRAMDGISKTVNTVRAYLIGQLAKNFSVVSNGVGLANILEEAYALIQEAISLVGGRVVVLECQNIPKLIDLYVSHGFKSLGLIDDDGQLVTMFQVIET